MLSFSRRSSLKILTPVLLVSLFLIQNHCGLLAASSLIQKSSKVFLSTSHSQTSLPPCHQKKSAAKDSKECTQECCTKLQAVIQEQQASGAFFSQRFDAPDLTDLVALTNHPDVKVEFSSETPPHLSFHRHFYQEAFPSHAPPFSLLA